jgi:hypothetical protein
VWCLHCRLHDWAFFNTPPSVTPYELGAVRTVAIDETSGARLGDDVTEEDFEAWVSEHDTLFG